MSVPVTGCLVHACMPELVVIPWGRATAFHRPSLTVWYVQPPCQLNITGYTGQCERHKCIHNDSQIAFDHICMTCRMSIGAHSHTLDVTQKGSTHVI